VEEILSEQIWKNFESYKRIRNEVNSKIRQEEDSKRKRIL